MSLDIKLLKLWEEEKKKKPIPRSIEKQLWKRLGIKKKAKKETKKKHAKRKRPKTPLERLTKQIQKDFLG